jgi:hypothetical protein
MGTQRVQTKGVLPWMVLWACRAGTRDFCPALAALGPSVPSFFSSPYTISIHLSPSSSKLGRQSWWVSYFLLCVSGFGNLALDSTVLYQYVAQVAYVSCWKLEGEEDVGAGAPLCFFES